MTRRGDRAGAVSCRGEVTPCGALPAGSWVWATQLRAVCAEAGTWTQDRPDDAGRDLSDLHSADGVPAYYEWSTIDMDGISEAPPSSSMPVGRTNSTPTASCATPSSPRRPFRNLIDHRRQWIQDPGFLTCGFSRRCGFLTASLLRSAPCKPTDAVIASTFRGNAPIASCSQTTDRYSSWLAFSISR